MKSRQHTRNNRVVGVMVSISAFQAGDMGSIPVPLIFFDFLFQYVISKERICLRLFLLKNS